MISFTGPWTGNTYLRPVAATHPPTGVPGVLGCLAVPASLSASYMPRIVLQDLETEKAQSVADIEATLGRDPASSFVIQGPNSKVVSGRHARIFFQDSAWWIEDTSRNGTVLDDERLQAGQRHAIRVGQVIGLGESGPRLRIMSLESRKIVETVMESPDVEAPPSSAVTQRSAPVSPKPAGAEQPRPARKIEEPTEPMDPSPDWLVHVVLRAKNTNQRFDVRALVVKLGRSPECTVQIPADQGASVSRLHAEIAIQDGGVTIRDAGSRNGTYVNGKRLDGPHPAAKSDLIMLGSGGPTFAIEDLHIVKGEETTPPSGGSIEVTPAEAKQGARLSEEPLTDPSPKLRGPVSRAMAPAVNLARRSLAGVSQTAMFKDVLEDMPQKSARRVRITVWAIVGATVLIAGILLGVTQWRVNASEQRMNEERGRLTARTDSIRLAASAEADRLRGAFDSARSSGAPRAVVDSLRDALADATRRTGVPEQALARARQSLDQQLATGDSARRRAEGEMTRLRAEVGRAQATAGNGSRMGLDSLRRALKDAELKAADVASQIRAVRGADLAQVAQLNQNAVGLVTMFADTSGGEGSGFAITPSGYFVTNRQVVMTDDGRMADSVFITMADQRYVRWLRADVIALGQGDAEIAVLKIRGYRGPYIKKVDWTAGAKQGDVAAVIGFPRGTMVALDSSDIVRTSMSAGTFSRITPSRMQFDGFSQVGSSGSPVFNATGEVVAVHFAGWNDVPGPGYAVPVSRVVLLLPSDAKSELGLR